MHIDTNLDQELNNDHPIIGELTPNEAAIYWSAVDTMAEGVEIVNEHQNDHGEVNFDSPDFLEANKLFNESTTLLELISEVALWRSAEGSPSKVKKQSSSSSDQTCELNNDVGEIL